MDRHAAMIGRAAVMDGYPMYYEATNEYGLSMVGLNFVGNCHFCDAVLDMRENLCQFEMIPYILGRCRDLAGARRIIDKINLVNEPFRPDLPLAELHWMLSDAVGCIVLEITREGVRVYDNPYGVLTNNPPFDFHENNMCMYRALSSKDVQQTLTNQYLLSRFSRGMGAIGLPGDWSSASRFVRAAFVRANAVEYGDGDEYDIKGESEDKGKHYGRLRDVNQFFHILGSVEMVDGCVGVENGFELTQYSCCCDTKKGIYYYKEYGDLCVRAVDMHSFDLDSDRLFVVNNENHCNI